MPLALLAMIKLPTFKFIFSTLFLLALYTQVYSQTYFWSNRGKIELLTDSSRVLITTPLAQRSNLYSILKTINDIDSVTILDNTKLLVALGKNIRPRDLNELKKVSVTKIFVRHTTIDGLELFPTDRITLELKEGINFESILKTHSSIIESYSVNKYGVYLLNVFENTSLTLANNIYEAGIVKYCHPEFIVKVVKFNNDPLFPEQYYLKNTGQFG